MLGCLNLLEAFASINGPAFYGHAPSDEVIELVRDAWKVLNPYRIADNGTSKVVVPFRLGETVEWKLE